MTEIFNIP